MGEESNNGVLNVISFGPLAETLGKTCTVSLSKTATCRDIIIKLGIDDWIENGVKVAINGAMVDLDSFVSPGDELAILPPVSGG